MTIHECSWSSFVIHIFSLLWMDKPSPQLMPWFIRILCKTYTQFDSLRQSLAKIQVHLLNICFEVPIHSFRKRKYDRNIAHLDSVLFPDYNSAENVCAFWGLNESQQFCHSAKRFSKHILSTPVFDKITIGIRNFLIGIRNFMQKCFHLMLLYCVS